MQQIANPYTSMLDSAYSLQGAMADRSTDMQLAVEQKSIALRNKLSATQAYEEQEAEFLAEFTYSDANYVAAKNSEQRSILRDQALIKSRTQGALSQAWRIKNHAEDAYRQSEMAYEQAETRWKEVRVAAELLAAAMRLAAQ